MQYRILLTALLNICLFIPLQSPAYDDGGRCPICGKVTMLGGGHICKKRISASKVSAKDLIVPEDRDLLTGKKLADMQKTLPPFSGFKVHGIEIVWEFNAARPCLKVSAGFGAVTRYELRDPASSYKRKEFEEVKKYYEQNVLRLPVLPTGLSEITGERFQSEVKPILDAILEDRRKAEERKSNATSEAAARQKESIAIFGRMNGLFGRTIFQERQASDKFSDDSYGGEYVEFTPADDEKFRGWKCTYVVTPTTHRIYEISGSRGDMSEVEMSKMIRMLEERYGSIFKDNGDGQFVIQGKSAKGNVRTLTAQKDGMNMKITLLDSAGCKKAESEDSVVQKHRRELHEERLARGPISVWPTYVPNNERNNARLRRDIEGISVKQAKNSVWVVFVDPLERRHNRFLAGDEKLHMPLDGIAELEDAK